MTATMNNLPPMLPLPEPAGEGVVERVAAAMHEADSPNRPFASLHESVQIYWRKKARAALAAMPAKEEK